MNEKVEELLKEIYDTYEEQISYSTDLWLKGEKHTSEQESFILFTKEGFLCYFKSLLKEVKKTYLKDILTMKKIEVEDPFKEHLNHEKIIR